MASTSSSSGAAISVQDLPHLHGVTKAVAHFYRGELMAHLETLAPLFRPRRLLGDYIEGASSGEKVFRADQNFEELRQAYEKVAQRPFNLRPELTAPLESISTDIKLYEREYIRKAQAKGAATEVTVSKPLTWYLAYPATYSPGMLRDVLLGKEARDPDGIKNFVIRALLMNLLFEVHPGLKRLMESLRMTVEIAKSPETGDLPLVVLSAPFRTVVPNDETILAATAISGREVFDEVLDVESVKQASDPLRSKVAGILREHGEEI